ncbi:hypothetical protein [Streptomyces sp. NPDC087270]|uniref:hypothetical protein n=1 Tax=Streptomyces sp. NPDC087270 TaxID=3365774 RepID=UPI0037F799FF
MGAEGDGGGRQAGAAAVCDAQGVEKGLGQAGDEERQFPGGRLGAGEHRADVAQEFFGKP